MTAPPMMVDPELIPADKRRRMARQRPPWLLILPWVLLWAVDIAAAGACAGLGIWSAAVPLLAFAVVGPLLWALNTVADRIEDLIALSAQRAAEARYTGLER